MSVEAELKPLLDKWAAGRWKLVRREEGVVTLVIETSGWSDPQRKQRREELEGTISALESAEKIRIAMTAERVKRRIIAIASGKGGVGKSTFATNLAVALQRAGHKVGLVDADIYGPSQPRLLDCEDGKPGVEDKKLIPVDNASHVPLLSIGHIARTGQAIAWRGPMAGNALGQLVDAHWGDVETLLVDMPPGTGDVQLTMIQKHKPDGVLIVSTPQDLALIDAVRAISLFDQGKVPVIGIVENMAGYVCPHCNQVSNPFGTGGAEASAKEMGLAFLGRVPLDAMIREQSDAGRPPAAGDGVQARAFADIAARLARWMENRRGQAQSGGDADETDYNGPSFSRAG